MSSATAPMDRPLRLLSLDGGGVRGLSTLLILRRLMRTIRWEEDNYKLPKPCDYFDLIGGTSTGGLIAIMLGRLEMDVQSCIDAYCDLSKVVFQDDSIFGKLGRVSGRFAKAVGGRPWFDAAKLETEVKSIVQKRLGNADAPLATGHSLRESAIVFVVATRAGSTTPVLLRSYQAAEESYNLTIWEACRATSAAPLFFEPIKVGKSPQVEFVDGAMGNNNPVNLVVSEARNIWPSSPFAVILSLGTGKPQMKAVGTKAKDVLNTCIRLATEADQTARQFRDNQPHMVQMNKYFRFNVEQGLQDVGMEEWKTLGKVIEPATMDYLDEVKEEIVKCARILKNPESVFINAGSHSAAIYDIEMTASQTFIGRTEILKDIEKFLLYPSLQSNKLRVTVLYGLGGIGKTQIAFKFADLFRQRYKYVFWIDAKSQDSVERSLARIVELLNTNSNMIKTRTSFGSITEVVPKLIEAQGKWLLIFDNVDFLDEVDIGKYLPAREIPGNIIITSRDPSSARLAAGGKAIEVGGLPEDDAINLLLDCSCNGREDDQRIAASDIVEELGYLPLAIDQAGCYISAKNETLPQYLRLYKDHRMELLKYKPKRSLMSHEHTVLTTWEISYTYIEKHSPIAARLLNLFAFFDNAHIPLDVLKKGCRIQRRWGPGGSLVEVGLEESTVTPWLVSLFYAKGFFDEYEYEAQIQELRSFSLVQQNPRTRSLSIHPLVHEWSRLRLGKDDQSRVLCEAIGFFCHAVPVPDIDDAVAEIRNDLALINTYYVTARLWVTGEPRSIYEAHVAEVVRTDTSNSLVSVADMDPKLRAEYTFLLLRSPLHSTSIQDTRSFFKYREEFLAQLANMTAADREYFKALEILSQTRCFADGSIFYFSVAQAQKVLKRAIPMKQLIQQKLAEKSLFQVSPGAGPATFSEILSSPGLQSVFQAGVTHYEDYVAEQERDKLTRPLKRLRTRFQKLSGFGVERIVDEDYEAWAEFAEATCRELLGGHRSGWIHSDPRINAVYGEAVIELAVMRYFYEREEGMTTLGCWSPTDGGGTVTLAERFTDGRKRLWLRMAEGGTLKKSME